MSRITPWVGAAIAAATLLCSAPLAHAAAPTRSTYTLPFPTQTLRDCGDFDLLTVNVVGEFTDITFTDASGAVTKNIRHATVTGDLVNSATGESQPYTTRRTTIFDASTLIAAATGLNRIVRLPGGGVISLAAGREIVDFSAGFPPATVETSGRSLAESDAQVCQLLA
jgi:hypothetical protein